MSDHVDLPWHDNGDDPYARIAVATPEDDFVALYPGERVVGFIEGDEFGTREVLVAYEVPDARIEREALLG